MTTKRRNPKIKNSIQPLYEDEHGTLRFKENAIVRYLLDKGPFDLNDLSAKSFGDEEWSHFAQLIGYSLGGYGSLSYSNDETYAIASSMHDNKKSEMGTRLEYYENLVEGLKEKLREPMADLYEKHPSDF